MAVKEVGDVGAGLSVCVESLESSRNMKSLKLEMQQAVYGLRTSGLLRNLNSLSNEVGEEKQSENVYY